MFLRFSEVPSEFLVKRLHKYCEALSCKDQWRRQGGQGGAVAPNVEKDGPHNSSKFDEKIGRGGAYPSQKWKSHKY